MKRTSLITGATYPIRAFFPNAGSETVNNSQVGFRKGIQLYE